MAVLLTKEEILNVNELKELEVPEWGGSVFMSRMSLADHFKYDEQFTDEKDGPALKDPKSPAYMLEYIMMVVKDANGLPLFNKEDMDRLASKSAKSIVKVFKACTEYNSMQEEIDDIKKKFNQAP